MVPLDHLSMSSSMQLEDETDDVQRHRRPRSLTIVHQPDLAFNHQSQAMRTSLLSELQEAK
jgi:hypothetical protein